MVVRSAAQERVELLDVEAGDAAGLPSNARGHGRHVVREPQDAAAGGSRHPHMGGVKRSQAVRREPLIRQGRRDGTGDVVAELGELWLTNVRDEDREQRVGVYDKQALAPVDPDEIGVPVVRCRRDVGDLARSQQLEQPRGAGNENSAGVRRPPGAVRG